MLRRIAGVLLKVLAGFVILEPIWMLLPFAGFLYGSAFGIQALSRNPDTAWLTHFVFPVLTLGALGPMLVVIGLALFVAGAVQIYVGKLRKSGLVTTGLYRFVRHPQYISLTLFGLGLLLTWGRAVAYVAFFVMMFVYYHLAKVEERRCRRLFGGEYERYRQRTSFLLPGDRVLRCRGDRPPFPGLPAPVRVAVAFVLTMAVCFGSMWIIDVAKRALRTVPFLVATVELAPVEPDAPTAGGDIVAAEAGGVPHVRAGRLVVVRGPYRNAAAVGFAERVLLRLPRSDVLRDFLSFLDTEGGDFAVVFSIPYEAPDTPRRPGQGREEDPQRRGPPPDPAGPDRVRLFILRVTLASGSDVGDVFTDRSCREIRGAVIAPVDLGREEEDLVDGTVRRPGPGFPGEERWSVLMGQLAARGGGGTGATAAISGRHTATRLVLVKAPILRTRLEPAFAQEILDRLVRSDTFGRQLERSGAGGEIVPVAFPRPGPDWYRDYHGRPRVSVFVVLVRAAHPAASPEDLFRKGGCERIGAFTAEMDLRIEPPADCVGAIAAIGPFRDLDERWEFFLSGL